jgi:branched-chain amino acid transport system substrate-binding protein
MTNNGLLAFAIGCISASCSAFAADPILVGAPITMTPPGPVIFGTQVRQGMDLATKIINEKGGVQGRKIEVLYEDHQGLPEKARAAAEKLITKNNVSVITGVELSPVVTQSIEVAKQYNIPLCNVNGWNDAIRTAGYPQVFNPNNFSSLGGLAIGKALFELGATRIVTLSENTDNGKFVAEGIEKTLKDLGWKGEFKITYVDRMGKDFLPAILPLKAFRPDVVVVQGQQPAAYIIMKQLYDQGIAPTRNTFLFDAGALADAPDFWDGVGEAGKYLIEYGLYHPGLKLTPRGDEFVKLFRQTYGADINRLALQGADCMFIIADAIKAAGSTAPDAVIKAMKDGKFEGTRGTISFSQEPGIFFQQWKETPNVIFQFTDVRQPVNDAPIVGSATQKLDRSKLAKP